MGTTLLLNFARFVLIGLEVVVLARVLLSFVDPGGRSRFAPFIQSTTEPLLAPIRKVLPRTGTVDFFAVRSDPRAGHDPASGRLTGTTRPEAEV